MTHPLHPGRRRALAAIAALASLAAVPALAHDRAAHQAEPTPPAPPGDSIYHLDATLQDQDGRTFALSSLRGSPVLASMFYASCDMVCPMIIETVHLTLRALPAADRSRVKILLASFDPERDTVAALKKMAQARGCDGNWLLARSDEPTARKIAAVLGIQYRKLATGEYNHSSVVDVIDPAGRIVARSGKLGEVDPAVIAAVRRMPRPA